MVGPFFSRKRKTFPPPKSFTFKRALLGHRTIILSKPILQMKKFWWSVADIGKSWNRAFSNSAEHYFQSRKQNEEYLFFPFAKRFPYSKEKNWIYLNLILNLPCLNPHLRILNLVQYWKSLFYCVGNVSFVDDGEDWVERLIWCWNNLHQARIR